MGNDRKATPQIVGRDWKVSVSGFHRFVVYQQFSGSSSINWTGGDRKSDTSICWKGIKCFSKGFIYVCCLSLFCQDLHRIFELEMTGEVTPQFVERSWCVSVTALNTIFVYHQLSGSSSIIWNTDDKKIGTSICRKGVKCFTNSFIYDCCSSSFVRIFIGYLKRKWQEKRHHDLSKRREMFQ